MKRLIIAFLIIGGIGAGVGAYYMRRGGGELVVNTLPVTQGDVIDAVGSTGTLQPVTTVTVGSQVSGNISELDADFNSLVHAGQIVAKIDPTIFQAQVDSSKANLANAKAQLVKDQVTLSFEKVELRRNTDLQTRGLVTQDALDTVKATVDQYESQIALDQAQIEQAAAQLSQNQANLDHTVIVSPIDGIVTQRSVDIGQTVAASMTAPTIYLIADDLTKMQVNGAIDESDVGRIRPGQHVTFHVDAYPGQEFPGTVVQIRLNPTIVNNVTTYNVLMDVPNLDYKLKPGMTANLKIQIAKRSNAVRVANAALRFRPTPDMFAALNEPVPADFGRGGRGGGGQGGPGGGQNARSGGGPNGGGGGAAGGEGQQASADKANGDQPGGRGNGGRGGGFGGGGGGRRSRGDNAQQTVSLDQFATMVSEQQKQVIDRMKARGEDTKAFEAAMNAQKTQVFKTRYGTQSAETINMLFPAIPPAESSGSAWTYADGQLKQVRLRLGITDGSQTELLSGDVQPGAEVVTGIVLPAASRTAASTNGNPLLGNQNRGGGPGGGPGGPGGGGNRGGGPGGGR
jgi:HlyD family secretion protein